jgi:hypothetical protein
MLHPNVGKKDRNLRIAAGVAIIGIGAFMGSWWGAIGIVPIATGLLRWCPAYAPLGISTCEPGGSCGGGESGKTCGSGKMEETGKTEDAGETEKPE